MYSRLKLISGLVALVVCLSTLAGLASPTAVTAQTNLALPWYAKLVENSASQTWSQKPGSQKTGPVQVVVHINKAPLAMVGKFWTHTQRRNYVKEIQTEQDKLIPQIKSLGGAVVGRFAQASTGLAVQIDASKVDDIRALSSSVIGVTGVANYEMELAETVPWIGATPLQNAGVTGTHTMTGQGLDVAVIDSGVDYTHKKLGGPGTVAAYDTCYATNATVGNADCPYFPNAKVAGGYDWVGENWPNVANIEPDPDPIDFEGHGTHVADIIGGLESEAGAKDMGVAPGVNIWGFKACSAVSSSCNGLALLLALDDALDLDDSDYGACDPDTSDTCTTFDPADVINMSLGSPYAQAEDDLTHFANIASYYGSVVVASAGNSGDKPYIVGSPSAADGAISVAASTVPSSKLYKISADGKTANGLLQSWSPAIPSGGVSAPLQYGAAGNTLGCAAFPANAFAGKAAILDRGSCAVSIKGSNASAAGAKMVIVVDNAFGNTPPGLGFGGGTVTVPTLTVTQVDGNTLKGKVGKTASISPNSFVKLQDDIENYSSRGPRTADGDIKPDIAAPSSSVSAVAGSGNGKVAFGGTSGAAPMVAGAAALIVQGLEERGILRDANPGVVIPGLSVTSLVKTALMNNANPNTYIGGKTSEGGSGFLAPITLQGAGRVQVDNAYASNTTALDVTDLYTYLFTSDAPNQNPPCTVSTPPTNAITHLVLPEYYNGSYDCLSAYPYGNGFFNAWNAATGSLSFGFDGVSATNEESRKVLIINWDSAPRTYKVKSAFRYDDDKLKGISISASPSQITVPGKFAGLVEVTLKVNAKGLREWTTDAGQYGNAGTNIFCNNPNPQNGCPTLTMYEYDGYVTIDGGDDNTVRMPWQILPKKAAETYVESKSSSAVKLRNPASYKPGDTDVFALVEQSPNNCEIVDGGGNCVEDDYVPGIIPGINATAIDMKEVGLRSYTVPGLNAALGLKAAPAGSVNDEVVDFGITVYDKPFRASHNYPVEFDVYVDSNSDGTDDYVVFNADVALGTDGRNAVFVYNLKNGSLRPYFYSFTDFNSQNWILPVPASAIGVSSSKPFKFYVLAFDNYFTGDLWDISPYAGGYHKYQTGLPKYRPVTTAFQVPVQGSYTLPYSAPSGGNSASPSQIGLLFMHRDTQVGQESDSVTLP